MISLLVFFFAETDTNKTYFFKKISNTKHKVINDGLKPKVEILSIIIYVGILCEKMIPNQN